MANPPDRPNKPPKKPKDPARPTRAKAARDERKNACARTDIRYDGPGPDADR